MYRYNGVYIQSCRTLEFSIEPRYDPSNTDAIGTRKRVRVRGFLSTSEGSYPGVGDSKNSQETIATVKAALETPRRSCAYSIGSTTLIEVNPTGIGVSVDATLGPRPMPAVVREVATGTFMIEHGFTVDDVDCDTDCESRDPVVSLRWTQTESFDRNRYSNLTTTGRLIVRADLLQSADNFRPLATPPLLDNYYRNVSKYTLSYDGLTLDFHFEDKESDRLPPFPATVATGAFTVVCEKPGFKRVGQVDIHLEGAAGVDRRDLMIRAMQMAYSKLSAETLLQEGGIPIVWGTFRENLFEPIVDVSVQAMLTPMGGGGFVSAALGLVAAKILGVKGKTAPQVMQSVGVETKGLKNNSPGLTLPERKRLAGLLTAAFRDPCACLVSEAELRSGGVVSGTNTDMVATNQNVVAEIKVADLTSIPPAVPLVKDDAPYDTYNVETTSVYDSGMVQVPGTGVGPNATDSATLAMGGGMSTVTTTFVAGRTGKPPVLPEFLNAGDNLVPLRSSIVQTATMPSPDGMALVFMVAGFYVHAVKNIKTYELVGSRLPYVTDQVAQAGASGATGFWANLFNTATAKLGSGNVDGGSSGSGNGGQNPFVEGGVTVGQEPPKPLGFDNLPISGLPIGGFNPLPGGQEYFDPPTNNIWSINGQDNRPPWAMPGVN